MNGVLALPGGASLAPCSIPARCKVGCAECKRADDQRFGGVARKILPRQGEVAPKATEGAVSGAQADRSLTL